MSEADVNVPDAQGEEKAYAAQDEPKGRGNDDADSDTAKENVPRDGDKQNTQTGTGNDSSDPMYSKPEEQNTDDIKSSRIENKDTLSSEEHDRKYTGTKETNQRNMDNDLFIMSSGNDTNYNEHTDNSINNNKNEQDETANNKYDQQTDAIVKSNRDHQTTVNNNPQQDDTTVYDNSDGNTIVNDNRDDNTTVNDNRDDNTTVNDSRYDDKAINDNKNQSTGNSKHEHDNTMVSVYKEPTEKTTSNRDITNNDQDDNDGASNRSNANDNGVRNQKEIIKIVDILDDDNEKEVIKEEAVQNSVEKHSLSNSLTASDDEERDDGGLRNNNNNNVQSDDADDYKNKEKTKDDKIDEKDDSTFVDNKYEAEPPYIEKLVASPARNETEIAQSTESPQARAGTKQENMMEWEKISPDEKPTSKKTDDDVKSIETRENESSKYNDDFEDGKTDDDAKSEVSITLHREDDYKEKDSKEQIKDDEPKQSARSEDEKHVIIAPEVRIISAKDKEKISPSNKGRQSKSPGPQSRTPTPKSKSTGPQSRTPTPKSKSPRPQYSRNSGTSSPYRRTQEERKFRRPVHSAPATSKSGINRPKSDGRRCISRASTTGKQKKEYKTEELRRLQEILKKERSHIRKPAQRDHFPFVWTSLEPYYNTHTAAFLIDLPGEEREPEPAPRSRSLHTPAEFRYKYVSRNTAHGLCDPWVDLRMDHEILPKIGSAQRSSTRGSYSLGESGGTRKSRESKKEKKEPHGGSTRLPKFPVVPFVASKENATQRFPYQEIPKFRQEMDQRFSYNAPKKIDQDYKRTKDDFYRMELDKLDEVHPLNRPHMRKAYFAYLQNTPGSKKAVSECVKSLDGPPREQQTGSAQEAS